MDIITRTITRSRLILVLAAAFFSTLAVYVLARVVYEPLAMGVAIAWGVTLLILVLYLDRKRAEWLGLENPYREMRALMNLQPMLSDTFLPYSFWAMEPTSILALLSTIQYNGYRTVVECGAGVSTLFIGKLLQQLGEGHVFSLEEDESWYRVMRDAIAHDGLSDYVTIVYAPLVHNDESGAPWYDLSAARSVLERMEHFDVLLIDGPKSNSSLSRFPALPFFAPSLSGESLIILDDSKRSHEKAVVRAWRKRFDLNVEHHNETLHGQVYIRLRNG